MKNLIGHATSRRFACSHVLVMVVLCRVSTGYGEEASKPLPNLEAITASYVQAVSSLRTIDCLYHLTSESHSGVKKNPASLTSMDVRFVQDGQKVAMRMSAGATSAGKTLDTWVAFDGTKYSEWSESSRTDAAAGYFAPRGMITTEEPTLFRALPTLETFLGKRIGGGPLDLETLLKSDKARIIGWEEVEKTSCVRVELGEHPRSAKNNSLLSETVVFLDPDHSFLPRKIVTTHHGKTEQSKKVVVNSFESVPDASGRGEGYWLPKLGTVENSLNKREFRLDSATVNKTLAATEFVATFPQGTSVGEKIAGQPPRTFVVGPAEVREALVMRATLPEPVDPPPNAADTEAARQLTAKPKNQNVLGWSAGAVGIVLLALAFFVALRKGR